VNPHDGPPLIFLIGYRGSGKSTVGPPLAAELGWDFVDADDLIEARAGQSITQIFASEGEAGFRDRESAMLQELSGRGRHVIATGGGMVERPANREVLRRSGWCVWLRGDPATLWERVRDDPTSHGRRPALTALAGIREVEEKVQAREPVYRETAHFAVETAGKSPDEVVSAILAAWTSS